MPVQRLLKGRRGVASASGKAGIRGRSVPRLEHSVRLQTLPVSLTVMAMKPLLLAAAALLLAVLSGCATTPPRNPLAQWHASPHFGPRRAPVIVLPHTAPHRPQPAFRVLQPQNPRRPPRPPHPH